MIANVAPPMLPNVREHLIPLLERLPAEVHADVRAFARHAGALGYAAGYSEGFEDASMDVAEEKADGAALIEPTVAPVVPLRAVVTNHGIPGQRRADNPCYISYASTLYQRAYACQLVSQHEGLHRHVDIAMGRVFMWDGNGGELQVLAPAETLEALLRAVLYDTDPDPERLRRMAAILRSVNLKDCLA